MLVGRVIRIRDRGRQWIAQYGRRLFERNAVSLEVEGRLPWIPLKLHLATLVPRGAPGGRFHSADAGERYGFGSAIRDECDPTIRQAPSQTQTRVNRNFPPNGWPLFVPDWTDVPVTTPVVP